MKEFWKKSNVPTILLAVILSLALWTTVQLNSGKVRQETIFDVPVRILEESTLKTNTGFSVIEGKEATIRVDYEAIGASVAELKKRNMEDIYAEVSVGAITEPGRTKVRYTLRYPDNLNISVRSTSPRLLEVWVDEIITREIIIEPYTEGSPAEGYIYDSLTPDHESVAVQGPAEIINQISYARATLAADGVTGSLTDLASISFFDVEGNLLDAAENHLEIISGEVNLSLSVLKEGIVPLHVDVTEAPGISAGMAKIEIIPESVKLRGDPLLIDRLAAMEVRFHTLVYKMTNNILFQQVGQTMNSTVFETYMVDHYRHSISTSQLKFVDRHIEIYEGIRNRNPEQALIAGKKHMQITYQELMGSDPPENVIYT